MTSFGESRTGALRHGVAFDGNSPNDVIVHIWNGSPGRADFEVPAKIALIRHETFFFWRFKVAECIRRYMIFKENGCLPVLPPACQDLFKFYPILPN